MAALGQLVLVAGLAFLVLTAQDQGHGGSVGGGGGRAIGAAAAITPQPPEVVIINQHPALPLSAAAAERLAESKLGAIPKSGPSDRWNYEVNHEKPSSGGRHRNRAAINGRRLGSI